MNRAEACQTLPMSTDEDRYVLVSAYTSLTEQVVDRCADVAGQGNDTLLASLAVEHDLRTRSV
jgi:hypothetical protein